MKKRSFRSILFTYLLALAALFLPAESITLWGGESTTFLFRQNSGMAVGGVLIIALLVQWIYNNRKNHWLVLPGLLAGLHTVAFAVLRIAGLLALKQQNMANLWGVAHGKANPQIGLGLLLLAGILLLVLHIRLLLLAKKPAVQN